MSEKKNKENLKKDLKDGFDMFDYKNFGLVNPNELKEIMDAMNLQEKNPFLYSVIDNLSQNEIVKRRGGISVNDFISIIDNELEDCSSKDGVEKIFSVFSNPISNIINLPTFSQTAKEIGDDEKEEQIKELIDKGQLNNDEFNFNDFYKIMKTNEKSKENNSNNESMVYVKKSSSMRDNNNKNIGNNNINMGNNNYNENNVDKFDNYVNNIDKKINYDKKNNYYKNDYNSKNIEKVSNPNKKSFKNNVETYNNTNNYFQYPKTKNIENINNNKEDTELEKNIKTPGYLKAHVGKKTPIYEKSNKRVIENITPNVNKKNKIKKIKIEEIQPEESGSISSRKRKYYRRFREDNSRDNNKNINESSNNSTYRENNVIRNVIEPNIEINKNNLTDRQNKITTKGKLINEKTNNDENKTDDTKYSFRQKYARNRPTILQENVNKNKDIKEGSLSTDEKIKRYHRRYRDKKTSSIDNNENSNVNKKGSKKVVSNEKNNNNQIESSVYLKYKKK